MCERSMNEATDPCIFAKPHRRSTRKQHVGMVLGSQNGGPQACTQSVCAGGCPRISKLLRLVPGCVCRCKSLASQRLLNRTAASGGLDSCCFTDDAACTCAMHAPHDDIRSHSSSGTTAATRCEQGMVQRSRIVSHLSRARAHAGMIAVSPHHASLQSNESSCCDPGALGRQDMSRIKNRKPSWKLSRRVQPGPRALP